MSAVAHEVPLPPPEKPEREHERRPEYERATIAVGAASIWVADVQRGARDFAARQGGGAIALTVDLDGERLAVRELRAGPGEGFVTFVLVDRELGVRLDRVAGIEFTRAADDESGFRIRGASFGFG